MKKLAVLFVMLGAIVAACAPQPVTRLDRSIARGSVVHMGLAVQAAAVQCTAHGKWLGRFGPEQQENADRLYEVCVRRLIPARDAVVFAPDLVDPWTPKSAGVVGCTGRTVRIALEALHDDFARFKVHEPEMMTDGIHVGRWAEQYALPSCDPMHPTTSVETYEDPSIPRIDPAPPSIGVPSF